MGFFESFGNFINGESNDGFEKNDRLRKGKRDRYEEDYDEYEEDYDEYDEDYEDDDLYDENMVRFRSDDKKSKRQQVAPIFINNLDDTEICAAHLRAGNVIIVNIVKEVQRADAQRILDVISGSSIALKAQLIEIAERTYLLAPKNITVSSDLYEDYTREPRRRHK